MKYSSNLGSTLGSAWRPRIILFCVLVFAGILILKLFFVQVVHSEFYSERADRQYSTSASDIFERGNIYFSRKDGQNVLAATQMSGFKVAIDPSKITDKEKVYEKLVAVVGLNREDFFSKAGKIGDPYEEVANHLSKEKADAVASLKISGVSVFKEKWRSYPGNTLASHTLGFVGYKGDELGGRYGLERQYDVELSRNKNNPYVNFFAEVFSNINEKLFKSDIREGNIITTIEPAVQSSLEKKLESVKEKYRADSVGGVIMNPKDGSIYALSAMPDFDLNNFSKVENVHTFSNPLVENVLEFGSVVKPLVMAAGLDAKVVTPETKYEDRGSVIVEKKEIFNFDKKARGVVSMQEVLNQSLNTGMVYVYNKLGKSKMRDYMLGFGIKEKTGIDLPNESGGLVSNLNSPRDIEHANAAFGQGIAMTPVALIRALASLGNGGTLVVPHVVKEIKYADGTSKEMKYETSRVKITEETSEAITSMLVTVMDKALQSGSAKLEHYSVAVKTGTAQVADKTTGGYYEDRYTHSFFGYFPAYDPQFIILLYAINPKGVPFASVTWTDPFLAITKFLLNYYEVPPDR